MTLDFGFKIIIFQAFFAILHFGAKIQRVARFAHQIVSTCEEAKGYQRADLRENQSNPNW